MSKFMAMKDISFEPAPELHNGIEPTGISGQINRMNVQVGGCGQDIITVMKADIVLDNGDAWLRISLAHLAIESSHGYFAKLVSLAVENPARQTIHDSADAGHHILGHSMSDSRRVVTDRAILERAVWLGVIGQLVSKEDDIRLRLVQGSRKDLSHPPSLETFMRVWTLYMSDGRFETNPQPLEDLTYARQCARSQPTDDLSNVLQAPPTALDALIAR